MSAVNVPRYTTDLADVSPTPPSDGQVLVYHQVTGLFTPTTAASGAPGPAGSPGSVLRDGTGAPSPSLGIDGDYYVDDATGNLYVKASGAYALASNLRGPQGVSGAAGPAGPPGLLAASSPLTYSAGTQTVGLDTTRVLQPSNNLSDLPTPSTARANLGLGSAATHSASDFLTPAGSGAGLTGLNPANIAAGTASINITGNATTATTAAALSGTVTESQVTGLAADLAARLLASNNLSDLPSAATARTNLGLGSASTHPASDFLTPSGNAATATTAAALSGTVTESQVTGLAADLAARLLASSNLSDLPSASAARTSLGLGSAATHPASDFLSPAGSGAALTGLNPASIAAGTAAINITGNAATATTSAALSGTVTESQVTGLTADLAARLIASNNLSDLPSASAARTSLGLGPLATQSLCAPSQGGTGSTSLNLLMNRGLSVVATRGNDLGAGRLQDTTGNGRTYVSRLYVPKSCTGLVLTFENYYSNNFYSDPNTSDILVKFSVSLDPVGLNRFPGYFGTTRAGTVPGGQTVGTRVVSETMGLYVSAGTYLYVWAYVQPVSYARAVTLTGSPTGGSFTLSFGGQVTTAVAWNATAAAVQSALNALTTTGAAAVAVGGPAGGPFAVTLPPPPSGSVIPTLTASGSGLTGGSSPSVTTAPASPVYFPLGLQTFGGSQATGEGYSIGTDCTDSGSLSFVDTTAYGPTVVQGFSTSAPFVTVGLLGDSIMRATGDIYPNLGFGVRGLGGNITTDGNFPYLMMARGGEKTTDQLAGSGITPLRGMVRLGRGRSCSHLLCNTATNDIGAGATLATVQANALTIWSQYANFGAKVYQTTCTPRTNSSDGWRTASSQGFANGAYETVRAAWNAWLRGGAPVVSGVAASVGTSGAAVAGQPGHPLTGVVDASAAVEANSSGVLTLNGGFWLPPSTTYDTGTSSGVVAANGNVLTDSTKVWGVNAHQGHRLVVTGGTNAGQVRTIQTNTATALNLTTGFLAALDATSTYQIDNGTVTLGEPSSMTGFSSGIHPSPSGHILMGSALASAAAAFST